MIRYYLLAILVLCFSSVPAWAGKGERNVALVIANGGYATAGGLANPVNDGKLVAGSLKKAGFDTVVLATDLDRGGFEKTLREFRSKVAGARVAMVYYAGHGIESEGRNWLLPVDAKLASSDDLPYEAVDLDLVMSTLNGAQVRMVVLDACRNNPFASGWRASNRAITRGLARIEADDFLVIYAAAPGQTAADGSNGNSPFAQSLASRIEQPGLAIQMLGGLVRDDVMAATSGKQRPFVSASITGTPVYLASPAKQLVDTNGVPIEEVLGWQGALNSNSREGFEAFLLRFPKSRFAKLAKQNLKQLGRAPAKPMVEAPAAVAPAVTAAAPAPLAVPTDQAGATAALNMGLLNHYAAQQRQILDAREEYGRQVAAVAAKKKKDEEEYQASLRAYAEERERWQKRAAACEGQDVKKCGQVAKQLAGKPSESTAGGK